VKQVGFICEWKSEGVMDDESYLSSEETTWQAVKEVNHRHQPPPLHWSNKRLPKKLIWGWRRETV